MKISLFSQYNRTQDSPSRGWVVLRLSLIFVAIILLIISVKLVLDYSALVEERKQLEINLKKIKDEKAELEYYYTSPIDEYYVRKYAWELYRLVPRDGKNYITDPTK